MDRRNFLKNVGIGAAAGTATLITAAPAIAATPKIKWRLASSFPKTLDTVYGGGEDFCRRVSELSEGNFEIRPFAGGEIVPALQVMDAVKDGTVECAHTAPYYFFGKNEAFAFDCAVQHRELCCWQFRDTDGWLVPQRDQECCRSQGPEDADRRIRRTGHGTPG